MGWTQVEYALGHGLANRTDFGGFGPPTTGETDGAVFVLFLVERKFSYYGSDLHDQRGFGKSKWIGDLDREAVRAMRNGGRIVDAVKNTVTAINSAWSDSFAPKSWTRSGRKSRTKGRLKTTERAGIFGSQAERNR